MGAEIEGTEIDEEIWGETGIEAPFEELEDQYQSSGFYLKIPFLGEEAIESEKKYWHKDFVFSEENETGKCNFQLKLRKELKPDQELRDLLMKGVWVELWETLPLFEDIPDPSEEA